MSVDDQQLTIFMRNVTREDTQGYEPRIREFLAQPGGSARHVILKNGMLYFFEGVRLDSSLALKAAEAKLAEGFVFSFDGERVTRMRPGFYLSPDASVREQKKFLVAYGEADASNNNNNNNNNNNGNNNNG